jgi:type III secretion protein U
MSGDSSGEKTEKASEKRLRDAHRKGEVAKSTELSGALSFLAAMVCVLSLLPLSARKLADLSLAVDRSFETLTKQNLAAMVLEALNLLASLSLLPVLVAAAIYTASLWLQVGAVFSLDPLKPKLDNLNPAKGMKKLFSMKSLVTFVLMLLKSAIVAGAVVLVCRQILPDAIRVIHADLGAALVVARTAVLHLVLWCGSAFVLLGAADYGYQKWQFLKDKRMSMQELKREHREDEGDPHLKAERKRVASEGGSAEQMQYMHLASLIVKDDQGRLLVLIYRPKQFKLPLYLLRSASAGTSAEVMAAAQKHGVKLVHDHALLGRLFPMCTTGAMVVEAHAPDVLRHLGVRAG